MKHINKRNDFITEDLKEEGLTIKEICDGVISGKLKVDNKGHNDLEFNDTTQDKKNKEYFTKVLDHLKKVIDRPKSDRMQEIYLQDIEQKFEPGQSLNMLISLPEKYCWGCDDRLIPILKSYNEVSFVSMMKYFKICDTKPTKDDSLIDVKDIPECELGTKNIKDKIVTEINLPTGDLVIANFFREKEIYDTPNGSGANINCLLGRIELAEYLEKLDVGYGQMGNMSIEVWKKLDGSEVLFTGSYNYDEETDTEGEYVYDGFKHLGNISLSVWRWMCADLVTLKKHNEKLPKLLEDDCVEDDYRDFILAKVKPGKWVIEHYYDIEERKDGIYTKLYLK